MIEKRFWYDFEDCNGPKIVDFKKDKEYPLETIGDFRDIEELLNNLSDENDQLKQSKKELQFQLNICADHRNEFHRGARENANRVGKLEKENEQLKEETMLLKRELDDVSKLLDGLTIPELLELVKSLNDENGELKQSVNNLKDTIIKITIAYQRKYDRTIVDLVDEVYEEDITDLIKELKE